MLEEPLAAIDTWISKQKEPDLSRPEAIRRLVEIGLKARMPTSKTDRTFRAQELATRAIDKMSDDLASAVNQASRKRRLTKGPEEFREVRVDRPKATKK
jgi:hypothetical protein